MDEPIKFLGSESGELMSVPQERAWVGHRRWVGGVGTEWSLVHAPLFPSAGPPTIPGSGKTDPGVAAFCPPVMSPLCWH